MMIYTRKFNYFSCSVIKVDGRIAFCYLFYVKDTWMPRQIGITPIHVAFWLCHFSLQTSIWIFEALINENFIVLKRLKYHQQMTHISDRKTVYFCLWVKTRGQDICLPSLGSYDSKIRRPIYWYNLIMFW